ncbi:GNAT family N-acetyltransferase [Sinorhizobium arboris]|uniref:GNAT family N-acetyltransferase n=1 Tax=Sinorhizobium arboris TaxID=76745 RepID=UPI000A026FC7|nr:GNAT family N-acetyltransferase [Sinorhizobium arboris]
MHIDLIEASEADLTTLQNLMQLYTHDFSEFWAGTQRGELCGDGRFPDYPIHRYFERADWRAYLFKTADVLVGFALVNDETHSTLHADHSIAEFFVVRKHRGHGLGRLAAQRLFEQQCGSWEVAVARKNTLALRFWRAAIFGCKSVLNVSELDSRTPNWDGPIIRFEVLDAAIECR